MSDTTALPAGRELDALVAEKVMGYAWARDGDDYALMRVPGTNWCAMEINRGERYYALLPNFSTDIAAAWAVVEHIQPTHWTKITVGSRAVTGAGVVEYEPWVDVEVGVYPTGQRGSRRVAFERGPLAELPALICRAALAAMEVGRE